MSIRATHTDVERLKQYVEHVVGIIDNLRATGQRVKANEYARKRVAAEALADHVRLALADIRSLTAEDISKLKLIRAHKIG